jgi:hypothetical protein
MNKRQPIDVFQFTALTYRLLSNAGVGTVGDLCRKRAGDLLGVRGFGRKCLKEVKESLADHGLQLRTPDIAPKKGGKLSASEALRRHMVQAVGQEIRSQLRIEMAELFSGHIAAWLETEERLRDESLELCTQARLFPDGDANIRGEWARLKHLPEQVARERLNAWIRGWLTAKGVRSSSSARRLKLSP